MTPRCAYRMRRPTEQHARPYPGLEHSSTTYVCVKEIVMSEEAQQARQALQESMDLREQGHTDE